MNIKQNYSAYWNAFKPFLNSLPTKDIISITKEYFRIKNLKVPKKEKCILVQELFTATKQKYIFLEKSIPKQSYVLEDPIPDGKVLVFPEDLKLRTYSDSEWISPRFDTRMKISNLISELPEKVKVLWRKVSAGLSLTSDEENSVIYCPGLTIFVILKYIEMHLSKTRKIKETKRFLEMKKEFSDREILRTLSWDELDLFKKRLSSYNRKLDDFEILSWLLRVFINSKSKDPSTPIYLSQHGKMKTPFGDVVW